MQYYSGLFMGEGVAGSAAIGASTSVLHSCMGIAFVNRARRLGGLYHYPAGEMQTNTNVSTTIRHMIKDIQPDEIVVTPARSMQLGTGSRADDVGFVVAALYAMCPGATVRIVAQEALAQLHWEGDEPVFNRLPDDFDPADFGGQIGDGLRGTMLAGSRALDGDASYYGGNGEVSGALDQGLNTTTLGSTGHLSRFKRAAKSAKRRLRDRCVVM